MSDDATGRLIGLGMAVALAPVWLIVAHFSDETRGFVVVCVTGVFAGIIYARRRIALQSWFLLSIALLYAAELSTAFLIPLPTRIPGAVMIPISFADLFLVAGILTVIEKSVFGRSSGNSEVS